MGAPVPRRRALVMLAAAVLPWPAGCGFQLRQAPSFAFSRIQLAAGTASPIAAELRRGIEAGGAVSVVDPSAAPEVVLDFLNEQREKVVVGLSTAGQVREFQLRTRLKFRLRTPGGKELIPETELLQQRDISFSETVALAKEAEEALLYRDMQADLVRQLMRRLAAVKSL